jgi:CubicO group peptidase (beta-lactamase class C family)
MNPLFAVALLSAVVPGAEREDLGPLLEPIRAKHSLPALGGLLLRGGEVVALGASGVRRQGADARVTPGDRWHLGSCTKAMTATLVARLVERGSLGWSTAVGDAFAASIEPIDPAWKRVTVEQLLQHRGGAPADLGADGLWARLWRREGSPLEQRAQLVRGVLAKPPASDPGTRFVYSNAGYAIAGAMLEQICDGPWEDLMRREIFDSLGMASAGFGAPGAADALDQPCGHTLEQGAWIPVEAGPEADNPPAIGPAGAVHATLEDWAKFVGAHVAGARGESGLLKAETFARLHALPSEGDYALGWARPERPWAGGRVLTHSGSNTMWFAVVWAVPAKDAAILVTCNAGGDAAARACDEAAAALVARLGK